MNDRRRRARFVASIRQGLGQGIGIGAGLLLVLSGGVLLAQLPHSFSAGDLVSASQINENFTHNQGRLDALENQLIPPIGTIMAWSNHIPGTPGTLPTNWVLCDGTQIKVDGSPLYDEYTPDLNNQPNTWNAKGSFLRGHTLSGEWEQDAMQGHRHLDSGHNHNIRMYGGSNYGGFDYLQHTQWKVAANFHLTEPGYASIGNPVDSGFGNPRLHTETRPTSMSVIWIMRVK